MNRKDDGKTPLRINKKLHTALKKQALNNGEKLYELAERKLRAKDQRSAAR